MLELNNPFIINYKGIARKCYLSGQSYRCYLQAFNGANGFLFNALNLTWGDERREFIEKHFGPNVFLSNGDSPYFSLKDWERILPLLLELTGAECSISFNINTPKLSIF